MDNMNNMFAKIDVDNTYNETLFFERKNDAFLPISFYF